MNSNVLSSFAHILDLLPKKKTHHISEIMKEGEF